MHRLFGFSAEGTGFLFPPTIHSKKDLFSMRFCKNCDICCTAWFDLGLCVAITRAKFDTVLNNS